MEGTGGIQPYYSGRAKRYVHWFALLLCLVLCWNVVYSADLFSSLFNSVYPQATGEKELKSGSVVVDYSNADKGYIMVKHSGSSKRLKTRVNVAGMEFTYDQNGAGEFETYPLQVGGGEYTVSVYEQAKGKQYAQVFSKSFYADVPNPNAAFLCPSQYVWYTPTSNAVAKSFELCTAEMTERERITTVLNYVSGSVAYDYMKAMSVQSGYLPDVDDTLSTRMGICFDYAALFACMLRVQGIPTKLAVGYLVPTNQYHAWNLVYLDGQWQLIDPTFKNSNYSVNDYDQRYYY